IGAGPCTNGQVLVLQDLLGVNPEFTPKFLRRYADSYGSILEGVNHFHRDVVSHCYPSHRESYK
ncbi:MAG: 3-methyl-2-oxobutanoate hydroxymethyltransferase, partial [Gammaproteobacteria bacterium]|nr:3-methyl-2-oxobutanoate hydroxymethyltransferase [Gammaproteobacteria bacterium]